MDTRPGWYTVQLSQKTGNGRLNCYKQRVPVMTSRLERHELPASNDPTQACWYNRGLDFI